MKKQLIIAITLLISVSALAQKKELREAEKAIKSSNFAEAKAALVSAKALMSGMDEDQKSKYYFLNAEALYAGGKGSDTDIAAAIESLGNVTTEYKSDAATLKTTMANGLLKKGNDAYGKKDYSKASKYFEKSYRLASNDTIFLYYAAATAINVQEYDRALSLYEELRDLGYTGIEKEYYATNKETGEEELLDKSTRDLYVKSGSYIKPGERKSESKRPEIIKNIALIYISNGDNEKGIEAIKAAREANPDDINLILSEANIYYKMGDTAKFKSLLVKASEMDPKNAELQYNLGVIAGESGEKEQAQGHYEKAIELDPTYINAYINLAALVLSEETGMIEEMNSLGTSAADNKRYDELREKRQEVYRKAVPYLTKATEVAPENIDATKTLMNIYSILGETDKFKALKAKVAELEGN